MNNSLLFFYFNVLEHYRVPEFLAAVNLKGKRKT